MFELLALVRQLSRKATLAQQLGAPGCDALEHLALTALLAQCLPSGLCLDQAGVGLFAALAPLGVLGEPLGLFVQRLHLSLAGVQLASGLGEFLLHGLACAVVAGRVLGEQRLLAGHRVAGLLGPGVAFDRDARVFLGIGELLEQVRAGVVVGLEKGRELALGQQHGAGELLER